jgi:hypothetical protein
MQPKYAFKNYYQKRTIETIQEKREKCLPSHTSKYIIQLLTSNMLSKINTKREQLRPSKKNEKNVYLPIPPNI